MHVLAIMSYPTHSPDIFRWKTFIKTKTSGSKKAQLNDDDIKQWMKRVEMASEFAVAEVFSKKKAHSGKHSMALQSTEQLQDHDDAYSEAQSILSEWMNQKLRLELEMDDEEEEEEMSSCKMDNSESKQLVRTTQPSYNNFDDMYSHLAQEEENSVVKNFLQDLMETEVLDFGIVEDLKVNFDKKRWRDPSITMEMRHKQVKENRTRRDAEREELRKEKEVLREAREEAWRQEQEKQARNRQEARKQEEMIQQEMIRLRREMEEKRSVELLARNMERDRLHKQRKGSSERSIIPKPYNSITQKKQDKDLQLRQKKLEAKVHLLSLQCMQRHFSAWYSVVLERRVCMGKASALCDWRRQLRAWRAWRALIWARREEREAERTEEELRQEHRRCQQAVESDRRRLLRRCLSDWHVWFRVECERKELLKQQEETRCKMAALINAAASGKLGAETSTPPPITSPPEKLINSENNGHQDKSEALEISSPASPVILTNNTGRSDAPPTQAWQVTRRHAALARAELRQAREGQLQPTAARSHSAELTGEPFKHRHAALQQTVAEQRRLLKEQQEQILHLQERQNMLELRHEAEKTELLAAGPPGALSTCSAPVPDTDTGTGRGSADKQRPKTASGENAISRTAYKTALGRAALSHPSVQGMEERARQRAERRREMEEQRRKRQEEKQAQMKAAEEERLRLEEEEKQKEAERKREEKRQQRKRELEKQKRAEQEKEQLQRATQHYLRTLLLHRGLTPWKRLLEQSHINTQRAEDHYTLSLQRRCFCSWIQAVDEAHAERDARAIQLYQQILLQRAVCNWKRLKDMRFILEARADRFYRTRTQRKVFMALLDHATEQRLTDWDNKQRAEEHNARRAVKRCFDGWRRLPLVLREEKEREARREQLRRKVAEILPDFRTSPIDSLWSSVNPL